MENFTSVMAGTPLFDMADDCLTYCTISKVQGILNATTNYVLEEMGKGVGTDATKNTFVRIYGLEKCEELVNHYTEVAIESLKPFSDTAYIIELSKSLTVRRV